MTSGARQISLLPGVEGPPASRVVVPGRRGRGATPVERREVRLEHANPCGRYVLHYEFRPLQRHGDEIEHPFGGPPKARWRVACHLLFEYFRKIGGFQTADDTAVRKWADALGRRSAAELRCAIEEKASAMRGENAGDTRDKRVYLVHPSRFVDPEILECWLDRSEEARRLGAARERAAGSATRQRLDELKVAPPQHHLPLCDVPSPDPLDDPTHPWSRLSPFAKEALRHHTANRKLVFEQLPEARLRILYGELKREGGLAVWLKPAHGGEELRDFLEAQVLVNFALLRWPALREDYTRLLAKHPNDFAAVAQVAAGGATPLPLRERTGEGSAPAAQHCVAPATGRCEEAAP